jgi:HAD superfamily hydrolase (TIGR01459 family)
MIASGIPFPPILTLADLVERHDILLVDQFGVLHDGQAAYPGAVEALSALKQTGATVVLLSNSGRRSAPNESRLVRLGFHPDSWDLFLSSGEVAWDMFSGGAGPSAVAPGARVLLLAREGDRSAVEGLDISVTESGEDADVVLLAGSEGDVHAFEWYRDLLQPAARRGVPLICTNPDRIMLTSVGPRFGAGRIAELYEELGGAVTWVGKPYPEIYAAALAALDDPDPARVACIGDSVEHDVAGAKGVGLSAALVRSGIHADMSDADLAAEFETRHARPDYIIPAFRW